MTAAASAAAPAPARKKRAHVHEIDIVRVLTFASVIAVHTLANANAAPVQHPGPVDAVWPNALLMLLHFTRSAFFALTGFVLTYQYLNRPVKVGNFWRRRLTLVGVPYVTWTVLYSFLSLVDNPLHSVPVFLKVLGQNLIYGTGWYHLYFLLVSMQIYLLFPWIQWLIKKTQGHHVALLVVSAVVQFGVLAALRYGDPGPGWAADLVSHADEIIVPYQFYVLVGAVAAGNLDRIREWVPAHLKLIVGGVVGLAALTELFFALEVVAGVRADTAAAVLQPAMFPWSLAATIGLSALGVMWSRSHAPDSTQAKWLRTASDRSFGVFLVHPLVLWVLLWAGDHWLQKLLPGPVTSVVAYLVVVAGAVVLTELFRHTPVSMPLTGRPPLEKKPTPAHPQGVDGDPTDLPDGPAGSASSGASGSGDGSQVPAARPQVPSGSSDVTGNALRT